MKKAISLPLPRSRSCWPFSQAVRSLSAALFLSGQRRTPTATSSRTATAITGSMSFIAGGLNNDYHK